MPKNKQQHQSIAKGHFCITPESCVRDLPHYTRTGAGSWLWNFAASCSQSMELGESAKSAQSADGPDLKEFTALSINGFKLSCRSSDFPSEMTGSPPRQTTSSSPAVDPTLAKSQKFLGRNAPVHHGIFAVAGRASCHAEPDTHWDITTNFQCHSALVA